jgi:UDP-3-O-[3-hydroxymyristoyl] glucosamine N-acyltransferase
MAAQVGVAGSSTIGNGVVLAGQVGVIGHIHVADGVIATGQTGLRGGEDGKVLSGSPAIENRQWLKSTAVFAKLPELQRRLVALEKKIEAMLGATKP